jgi:hypothetical protein
MLLLAGERFHGDWGLTIAHDKIQTVAGYAMWPGEFPSVHAGAVRLVPETIIWIFSCRRPLLSNRLRIRHVHGGPYIDEAACNGTVCAFSSRGRLHPRKGSGCNLAD